MPYDTYTIIRVSLPLEGHTRTTLLQDVITLLHASAPIGVMGEYKAVYDLSDNLEGFTPLESANPTYGAANQPETSKALLLKTYAHTNTPEHILEKFLNDLYAIHPWEHPGIELQTARLWRPEKTPKVTP